MTIQPTYPGVYVQEVPSGVRTIAGVSTSTTLFIGAAKSGPLNQPVLCTNYTEFVNVFSADSSRGDLVRYVRLFFLNGGTRCYVMRISHGATKAYVTLKNEAGAGVLKLTAKSAGLTGENLRTVVTYKGLQPEVTFNLEVWQLDPVTGVESLAEQFLNLSMDPLSATYAPLFLSQGSRLIDATDVTPGVKAAGVSRAGRPIRYLAAGGAPNGLAAVWDALVATSSSFLLSVGGKEYRNVVLSGVAGNDTPATLAASIQTVVTNALTPIGATATVSLVAGPAPGLAPFDATVVLVIQSTDGDVFIKPAPTADLASVLMLGTAQGGLEVGSYAARRPAPNGVSLNLTADAAATTAAIKTFGNITATLTSITIQGKAITPLGLPAGPLWVAADGSSDGVRKNLALVRDAINTFAANTANDFPWRAEVWGSRLNVRPTSGADNTLSTPAPTTSVVALNTLLTNNVQRCTVGVGGAGLGMQTSAAALADDGNEPQLSDYDAAYLAADEGIDIFNLLVLPPTAGSGAIPQTQLWPNASVFCQSRRAFLLMDSPAWADAQAAINGIASLRTGLVKDHAALFHPKITIQEDGLQVDIGPSGAIAGLCARIDSTRGVWKAPAGTEADLRGVVGVSQRFTDAQQGVMNPEGIDVIRSFPAGIVNWGARTMDGADSFASEYKYIPIRRLALYIEESLYRGLKWAVFEPNDEPLWAQIRLNVGAFMHDLFRQGAFQGSTPSQAYFVKCDAETTTQSDRNLGKVNIWVGFAPLKPAEFVLLYLQQMAGQL